MSDVLFVSESEITPELLLAQDEMAHYGYSLTFPLQFIKVIDYLKASTITSVLINGNNKKVEAYELAKCIREQFRGAIKVFVFMPESSANEGSKFGLVNAEVEDKKTIKNIVDKLPKTDHREYILEENVISLYNMSGGAGSSTIAILLAYVLNHHKQDSLLAESTNARDIKRYLGLETKLALLTRDKSKELDQAKDLDWFEGFLSKTPQIPKMHYLNLFSQDGDRTNYLEQSSLIMQKLAKDLNEFLEANRKAPKPKEETEAFIFGVANSLQLISKDLEGESYTLFDEVVQLGGKLSNNIIFDLGSDVHSSLNKQLLNISNNLVVIFRDTTNIKDQYLAQKKFFEEKFKLNVIPVIAPPHYYYSHYEGLSPEEWMNLLGEIPVIYPFDPETIVKFIFDRQNIDANEKLFRFTEDLLSKTTIKLKGTEASHRKGLLDFLTKR